MRFELATHRSAGKFELLGAFKKLIILKSGTILLKLCQLAGKVLNKFCLPWPNNKADVSRTRMLDGKKNKIKDGM